MFIEIVLALLLGISAGIITGLTPGIHVNLICALLLSSTSLFFPVFGLVALCCFIVAMATTHTFLDTLPSVFLGAPESATALGVLPGHRYVLKGFGLMAVKLTVVGSLGALLLSTILFPLLLPLVDFIYPFLKAVMGWLLLAIALFMVLRDNKPLWAALIFVFSGALGLIVFDLKTLENSLFPLLSGLFGIATLAYSLKDTNALPKQKNLPYTELDKAKTLQALGSGTFSGFLTAVLPGVGAATAAVLAMQITRKLGDHGFMVLLGGISTSNFVLSLVTLLALDKARNGALIAVQSLIPEVSAGFIMLLLATALIAGSIAAALALFLGRGFAKMMTKVPYRLMLLMVIGFIIALTPFLSGLLGVGVLIVSTAIGLLPAILRTSRTMAMGCLLVPVMSYFLPL